MSHRKVQYGEKIGTSGLKRRMRSLLCISVLVLVGVISGEEVKESFLVKVENYDRGACTGIIMNEYLIITSYYCASNKEWNLVAYPIFYSWDLVNQQKLNVGWVASPVSDPSETWSYKAIVFMILSEPIWGTFYPPCKMPRTRTMDFAFVASIYDTSDSLVRVESNCSGSYNAQAEFCFDIVGGNFNPNNLAAVFDKEDGVPKCVVGVYYQLTGTDYRVIRLDYWWDQYMDWFSALVPGSWTETTPIL